MKTRPTESAIGCVVVALLLLFALLFCQPVRGDGTFSGANTFTVPGSITLQPGINLYGTWNFGGATVQGLSVGAAGVNGELQWNNTGVLNGLSTLTTDGVDITTPASRFYFVDITDPTKKVRFTLSGVGAGQSVQVTVTNNSATVIPDAGAANQFLTGITTSGGVTKARPTIANLTDLSGTGKIVGSNASSAAVTELTLGNNLSIVGNQINAATGGVADGDKGDIAVTGGGATWTIDSQAVTYPKLQNVTQNRILGRVSSGAGQVEELTGAQVTPLLSVFGDATAGLVPASGGGTTTYLRADHTFAAPPGSGTVTTTGVPLSGHLAQFSGQTSITNVHNALGVVGFIKSNTDDSFVLENAATHRASLGAGTVTSFSAGDLSPLFTTTEATVTTTPALSFALTAAPAHNYFGNNTASSGAPAYHQINYTDLTGTASLAAFSVGGPSVVGRDTGTGGLTTLTLQSPLAISAGALIITDGAISRAKLVDGNALSLVGRSQNSTGDLGDIATTAGSNAVFRESGSNIGWGQVATGGITDRAVTLAKIQNASASARIVGSNASGSGAPYSELTVGKNLEVTASGIDADRLATGENQTGFSSDQYITGSRITVPAGTFTVGMMYHVVFQMSKTAAGTSSLAYTLRVGTAGTTADQIACQITPGAAGTAAIDTGIFESWFTFRSSGASTVIVGTTRITKNGSTTGLMDNGSQLVIGYPVIGSSFNSSAATKIGMSFNGGGGGFSGTIGFVKAELVEP